MSDQQRMLLAAVLMAVVLFVSWTLTDRGVDKGGAAPPARQHAAAQPPPDTTVTVPAPPPDTTMAVRDSIPEGAGEGSVTVMVMDSAGVDTLVSARLDMLGGGIGRWELHDMLRNRH